MMNITEIRTISSLVVDFISTEDMEPADRATSEYRRMTSVSQSTDDWSFGSSVRSRLKDSTNIHVRRISRSWTGYAYSHQLEDLIRTKLNYG